jgi:hypothetical protein
MKTAGDKINQTNTFESIEAIPQATSDERTAKILFIQSLLDETEFSYDSWHNENRRCWVIQGVARERLINMINALKHN